MPGWFSLAYKSQLWTLFSSFIFECHTGSLKLAIVGVFTPWKLENASNQSFLLPGNQFLKFINIPLLIYHSKEIILVKATYDHKVAKSNMYFYLLFIWTLSHIWYSDHFFLLEILSSIDTHDTTSFSFYIFKCFFSFPMVSPGQPLNAVLKGLKISKTFLFSLDLSLLPVSPTSWRKLVYMLIIPKSSIKISLQNIRLS